MTSAKTILVLGGGIGGSTMVRLLRGRLPSTHRVILVERDAQHVFPPSLLWLMVGRRREQQISRPFARMKKAGIDIVQGEIERIDPQNRSVQVGGTNIAADYMVVALGADLAPATIPGLTEAGHNFYTLSGAQSLDRARVELHREILSCWSREFRSNVRRRPMRPLCCSRRMSANAVCMGAFR